MFDWLSGLFKGGSGDVNPESGLVENQYSGIGNVEGPNEGSGEGMGMAMMKQGSQLGQGLKQQAQLPQPDLIPSGLTAGFDQNWLSEQSTTGSAMGQKL